MDAWVPQVLACWRRGQELSAVGPGAVERHLEHARALAGHLAPEETVGLDLGTGAGVPGLALAGFRPDMRWILLDAAKRRVDVVQATIDALGWGDRVEAIHGRAEDRALIAARSADVVVARLFGPPSATAECAAPLVRAGGRVLVTEPPPTPSEENQTVRWSERGLEPLGLALGRRFEQPIVQELVAVGSPEGRFPRKPGVAVRRPLW